MRRQIVFLSLITGMLVMSLWPARADESLCHDIPTAYEYLRSSWRWIDNETVIFSVGNGLQGGIYDSVERTAWYEYHVSTHELRERALTFYDEVIEATVPAGSLIFLPQNKWGSYEDVFVSPSGQQFVYSEYDPKTAITQVWYDDRQAGHRFALDFKMPTYDLWQIDWAADGQRFVVHLLYGLPMYVVTIEGDRTVIDDITHISSLEWLGEWTANGLTIKGISPDGRYILGQAEIDDQASWVFIWDEARYEKLNFRLYEADGVAWINNTTFVTRTSIGLVEYDLARQRMKIRPTMNMLDEFWGRLSPDGRYIIGEYHNANYSQRGFRICRVG